MFKSFFSPIYQLENFIHYLLTDDKWRLLILENEGSRLVSASQYQGLNNYDLVDALQKDFGSDIAIIPIGQAGERGYLNSTVQMSDPEGRPARAAARRGAGGTHGFQGAKGGDHRHRPKNRCPLP
ncbi:aldehyde ferredoxin oxidoreductase N-terminal domain-containing protein [Desulfocicer niacini]